jgi:hypothetical protein
MEARQVLCRFHRQLVYKPDFPGHRTSAGRDRATRLDDIPAAAAIRAPGPHLGNMQTKGLIDVDYG